MSKTTRGAKTTKRTKTTRRPKAPAFTIRLARPEDKERVLSFTKKTFGEEGDYIADVWERWLGDGNGYFWAAEYRGRAVGIAKLTFHSPQEAWMEGLRVDPRHREKGIARVLHQKCVEAAQERGMRVVRFATHSQNKPVHLLAKEFGFRKVAAFAYYRAEPGLAGPRSPFILSAELFPVMRDYILASPFLKASGGLVSENWIWRQLSPERLQRRINRGEVVAYLGPGGGVDALAILRRAFFGEGWWISYLEGKPAAVLEMAMALRYRGDPPREVEGMFPEFSPLTSILEEAGYERGIDYPMWIFEKEFAGKDS